MGVLGTGGPAGKVGSFFSAPDWVDKSKKPGWTNQAVAAGHCRHTATSPGTAFASEHTINRDRGAGGMIDVFVLSQVAYPEFTLSWFIGWANPWNFFINSPNFVWYVLTHLC